jgi:tetratricopeptide (TPR) repeat protein
VHRYNELNTQLEETKKQLAASGINATLVQTVQDLLHEGKLEEARAIFDRLILSDAANVDRAAQDHFGRASIFALQFRFDRALPDYAMAYQYRPDDPRYADAYAYALMLLQRDDRTAEMMLRGQLRQAQDLAAQDPAHRPDLAATLNNMGVFYRDAGRFAEAEVALMKAAAIRRELATQNAAAFRPDLAATLIDLASLYRDMHRDRDAAAAEAEALAKPK